ncbi:MAG: aldehyde ferredoxin oxidoreductase C-terminal domain-containing protein [Spirochaetales bacterium]|nr:aldehyde ferredoxin oxidoreductase C-terminal domain-containing protein [Spirochaetales bacterium]MCF7937493.1 aldehyde ferredoxin oxidoreductase C-terminal domain-containing protein [Spirochaetales bacterium]
MPPFNVMLNEYYHNRGWDDLGVPQKEKLEELALV